MALNPDLLRETYKRIGQENGGSTKMGMRFYQRLFEKYPQVKPLFNTPPEEQHKKLIASIGAIVAGVSNLDLLLPYLRAMAIRHLAYKTENEHYAAVGENLLAVMKEHLSVEGQWTDEMQAQWEEALSVISSVMTEAASSPDKYKEEIIAAGYEADGFKKSDPQPWLLAV